MNKKYTNITIKKDTLIELNALAKTYHLTKDETVKQPLQALSSSQTSRLQTITDDFSKRFRGFKASEHIDLDDIDSSEAYI